MSSRLTEVHKLLNGFIAHKGCVTDKELEDMYKSVCAVYPQRSQFRARNSEDSPMKCIIDEINKFMSFMNASIICYDCEINQTRYWGYFMSIPNDTTITKCATDLPLSNVKLFRKILNVALLNKGLITRITINKLNSQLSRNAKNSIEIVDFHACQTLIVDLCNKKYLFPFKQLNNSNDNDDKSVIQVSADKAEMFCVGPRSMVELQQYISDYCETQEIVRTCTICLDYVIGVGFKCNFPNCKVILHSKCVELSNSKKCPSCSNKWAFDPMTRIGILSDPHLSEDWIDTVVSGGNGEDQYCVNNNNNKNVNRNNNNRNDSDSDTESETDSEDQVIQSLDNNNNSNQSNDNDGSNEENKENGNGSNGDSVNSITERVESQSLTPITTRRSNRLIRQKKQINDDSDGDVPMD